MDLRINGHTLSPLHRVVVLIDRRMSVPQGRTFARDEVDAEDLVRVLTGTEPLVITDTSGTMIVMAGEAPVPAPSAARHRAGSAGRGASRQYGPPLRPEDERIVRVRIGDWV